MLTSGLYTARRGCSSCPPTPRISAMWLPKQWPWAVPLSSHRRWESHRWLSQPARAWSSMAIRVCWPRRCATCSPIRAVSSGWVRPESAPRASSCPGTPSRHVPKLFTEVSWMKPDRVIALLLVAALGPALASGPTLYSQPAYESPVRAGPDELLLLPGAGLAASDRVIFQRSDDSSAPVGSAEIVSTADVPNSL